MARKFDLGMAIVAGLVIFVVLTGSGCLDENPVDTASDDTLEDITDGEMTDASGTMDSTLFKMAEEASGGYEPVTVAGKVQVEVLDDGSIAPYDIDNLPENLPADVALDTYTHPEKYFSIVELPNGNLKIIGLQELDGWKITRSYDGKSIDIHETDLNNDVFGDVVMKTSYSKKKGNPSGNEITAVLGKNQEGKMRAHIFVSPEWSMEEYQRKAYCDFMGKDIPIPWDLGSCVPIEGNEEVSSGNPVRGFRVINVGGKEIRYFRLYDFSTHEGLIFSIPTDETKYYEQIPGIVIKKESS